MSTTLRPAEVRELCNVLSVYLNDNGVDLIHGDTCLELIFNALEHVTKDKDIPLNAGFRELRKELGYL